MSDGMELYVAYLHARDCAENLLTAHHIKEYRGDTSKFRTDESIRLLGKIAQALGYTLTPIKAEVLEAAE